MDLDARTQETAATLLGVAYTRREASDSSDKDGGRTWEAGGAAGGTVASANNPHAMDYLGSSAALPSHYPSSSAAACQSQSQSQSQSQHQSTQSQHQSTHSHHHAHSVSAPAYSPHQPTADTNTNTMLSMSSIGFGIDSSSSASWGDATEAAVRALQDAMERSTLRLPMTMSAQHLLQIKVQLGVPPKQIGSSDPMVVDVSRLASILPRAIPVFPIRVVVGGLFLMGESQGSPSICTAVACITIQSQAPLSIPEPSPHRTNHAIPSAAARPSPWASLEVHQSSASGPAHAPTEQTTLAATAPAPAATPVQATTNGQNISATANPVDQKVHKSTSIEMLAMISEEIRLAADNNRSAASTFESNDMLEGQATAALHQQMASDTTPNYGTNASNCSDSQMTEEEQLRNGNYNYKKLPPGVTTKNNRRLFVKHTYRDHSGENPLPEELDLLIGSSSTSSARTPNAAFPLKLHETLTQIENNGHGDIIGWMPHGRSFKIHKQKEFAEIILPRYFVMTKKSSFLRQLNLYGFNRFSAGNDQGSYYHEKFLRGMKFLCRRMTRQKVNGNRIRSAGNPDEEPSLCLYPSCPPPVISSANPQISSLPPNKRFAYVSREDEDGEDDRAETQEAEDDEDTEDEEYNQLPAPQRNNGGVLVSFPLKLQRMLDKLEAERNTDIISWLSHGRAFIVRDPEAFVDDLMPIHFNQTKYSSFQRQLHMYNFQRITTGQDKGAYHNSNFQRGKPHVCSRMVRTRINGKGCRKPGNPNNEPNLYSFEPLPPIAPGTTIEVPDGNPELDDDIDSDCS
jgi:hypothetical protein